VRERGAESERVMKFFKWTIEIQVAEMWVVDGFALDDYSAVEMLAHALPYAYGHELKACVLTRPNDHEVAAAQGFRVVTAFRDDHKSSKRCTEDARCEEPDASVTQ
jgi:hypothetical protein